MDNDLIVLVLAIVAPSGLQFLAQPLLSLVLANGRRAIQRNPKVVALMPVVNIAIGSTTSYTLVAYTEWVENPPTSAETLKGIGVASLATLIASVALFLFSFPTLWVARDTRWPRQLRTVAVAFFVAAPTWTAAMLGLLRLLIPFTEESSVQVTLSINSIASTLLVQIALIEALRRDWLGYPPEDRNPPNQGG